MKTIDDLTFTNESDVAAKPTTKAIEQVNSLNSSAVANVFKTEFKKITATSLEGRAKALLAAANKALDKAGLPRIDRVRIAHLSDSPTEGTQATYNAGSSTLTINDTALRGKKLLTTTGVYVYHEMVHHQQTYNVARYLASSNGKSMTAQEIRSATGIDQGIINKAVKSVNAHKTKSPLTTEQFHTAQSIYRSLYDQTNTITYNNKTYQYSAAIYQYLNDASANLDKIKKNPSLYTQNQVEQANAMYNNAYKLYQALPNEKEAFDVQERVRSTKQGTLRTSSQNENQVTETTNLNSTTQLAVTNTANSEIQSDIQLTNSGDSTGQENSKPLEYNSSQNISNDQVSDSTDISKVISLLKDNAAEVRKQYGFDVNTDDGLGKAVMQYWKENKLDPKTLKEQLPNIKDSEFVTAFTALANATETAKTKEMALQR
jgi:hypothetical protein